MNEEKTYILTQREMEAIFQLYQDLSGSSPENVFAWDGTDHTQKDSPYTTLAVKVFRACGRDVPNDLEGLP